MNKTILFFALLIVGATYAQNETTFENDTLTTTTGFKVYKGLDLKIGTGSMDDGDFRYIRINENSVFTYSADGNTGVENQANSMSRSNSGLTFTVRKIMPRGSKKRDYVYYAKIGNGIVNYEVDIVNAIKSGEIIVPEKFMPETKSSFQVIQNSESKYDKLKKIKELKDTGVLTEEEFQKEKEKIMKEN